MTKYNFRIFGVTQVKHIALYRQLDKKHIYKHFNKQ